MGFRSAYRVYGEYSYLLFVRGAACGKGVPAKFLVLAASNVGTLLRENKVSRRAIKSLHGPNMIFVQRFYAFNLSFLGCD